MINRDDYLEQQRDLLEKTHDSLGHGRKASEFYSNLAKTASDPQRREWAAQAHNTLEELIEQQQQMVNRLEEYIQKIEDLPSDSDLLS